MGREIRTVPIGWEHPKDERGHYEPIYDKTFKEAIADYIKELQEWVSDTSKFDIEDMLPPNPVSYRSEWEAGAAMGYCVYETVSEGTPVSPIFSTKSEIAKWLTDQGYSEKAAQEFIRLGFSFSMVLIGGRFMDGIAARDYFKDDISDQDAGE